MPSFDVVSEVDLHELANAVDQANREVTNRFDFKGTGAEFTLEESTISLKAQVEFQLLYPDHLPILIILLTDPIKQWCYSFMAKISQRVLHFFGTLLISNGKLQDLLFDDMS